MLFYTYILCIFLSYGHLFLSYGHFYGHFFLSLYLSFLLSTDFLSFLSFCSFFLCIFIFLVSFFRAAVAAKPPVVFYFILFVSYCIYISFVFYFIVFSLYLSFVRPSLSFARPSRPGADHRSQNSELTIAKKFSIYIILCIHLYIL